MPEKSVTFNSNVQIKKMYVWSFAHNSARKGTFPSEYLDRLRFNNKIRKTEIILSPILNTSHRKRMYKQIYTDT